MLVDQKSSDINLLESITDAVGRSSEVAVVIERIAGILLRAANESRAESVKGPAVEV